MLKRVHIAPDKTNKESQECIKLKEKINRGPRFIY